MVKIFISYRRADSQGSTGRLHDHLIQEFRASDVFLDVEHILPGENFEQVLDQELARTDIMLVVIGPRWLSINDEAGRSRLDKADDYVRKEVSNALNRKIAVIPILVDSATMPKDSDLPADLVELAFKQAFILHHESFKPDVQRLIDDIKRFAPKFFTDKDRWPKEFEETIGHDLNSAFLMESVADDYRLRLYYGSKDGINTRFDSHLLKDAIVNLIKEADLTGWMKHADELQPDEFWTSILKAVIASYRVDLPYSTEDRSNSDILRQLLSNLGGLDSK